MTLSLLLKVAIGAGIGAALGYFGQCSSGTCPLTATWWRGAIFGGILGLVFAGAAGGGSGGANVESKWVRETNTQGFDAQLAAAAGPVLVDFYAPWCGPCKRMAPVIETLAKDLSGSVTVLKVNVDKNPELAQRYAIRGVPTLILFEKGQPRDTLVGLVSETELRTRLARVVGEAGQTGKS